MAGLREVACHFPGDLGSFAIQVVDLVLKPIFAENDGRTPKRVRFDDVGACLEVVGVHSLDDGWFGDDKILIAAGQFFTAEIVGRKVLTLQVRSGGTVEDDDSFAKYVEKGLGHGLNKKAQHESCAGHDVYILRRFSSLFTVASKLSLKSPHTQDTKHVYELQTEEKKEKIEVNVK